MSSALLPAFWTVFVALALHNLFVFGGRGILKGMTHYQLLAGCRLSAPVIEMERLLCSTCLSALLLLFCWNSCHSSFMTSSHYILYWHLFPSLLAPSSSPALPDDQKYPSNSHSGTKLNCLLSRVGSPVVTHFLKVPGKKQQGMEGHLLSLPRLPFHKFPKLVSHSQLMSH